MTNIPIVEATKKFYKLTKYPSRSYLDNPEQYFKVGNYDKILENTNGLCYNEVMAWEDALDSMIPKESCICICSDKGAIFFISSIK